MARSQMRIQKPRSWWGILLVAIGGVVLLKAFFPAGDQKLAGVAQDLKNAIGKANNGGSPTA